MKVEETELPGVLLITPRAFQDDRGYFFESYSHSRYASNGVDCHFVQDNVSFSQAGVIRGLHYQLPNPQAKLIQVLSGAVLDIAVDIRKGSPSFGKWIGRELTESNHAQLFIPAGFAHGFAVIGNHALVSYKCSTPYEAAGDATILWNDPEIGVDWPVLNPILSAKDNAGVRLVEAESGRLPTF